MSKKKQRKTPKKRNRRPLILFVFIFVSSLLFFRDKIASHVLDIYLVSFLPKEMHSKLVIEQRKNSGGHLFLQGVSFISKGMEIKVEEIDIYSCVQIFPFNISYYVNVENPEIKLPSTGQRAGGSSFLGLVFPHDGFSINLRIEKGTILMPEEEKKPLYFSFLSDGAPGNIGEFKLSDREDINVSPLCVLSLSKEEGALAANVQVESDDLTILQPLARLLIEPSYPEGLKGRLKAKGAVTLTKAKDIQTFSGEIDLQNFSAEGKEGACKMGSCSGYFSYPAMNVAPLDKKTTLWKKTEGHFVFSGGEFSGKNQKFLQVKEAKGEILLTPSQDPLLNLSALLTTDAKEMPFELHSSGVIHEDGSFWVRSDCLLSTSEKNKAEIILSFCKIHPHAYVVQADFLQVNTEALILAAPFFKEKLQVAAADIQGSVTAKIEHHALQSIHWNRLKMEDAGVLLSGDARCCVDGLMSDGHLVKGKDGWHLQELQLEATKGSFDKGDVHITDVGMSVNFHDNIFEPSTCSSLWNKGQLVMSLCGPINALHSKIDITSSWKSLLALFDPSLCGKEDADMITTIDLSIKGSSLAFQGKTKFQHDSVEESGLVFSAEVPLKRNGKYVPPSFADVKGSLHANALSEVVYAPFLSFLGSDLTVSGKVLTDMTLSLAKIQGKMESEDLFIEKSGMALSTGPIKEAFFTYDCRNHMAMGALELQDGFFADRSSEFTLTGIKGRFTWQDHKLKGQEILAACEGIQIPFSLYFDHEGLFVETALMEGRLEELCNLSLAQKMIGPHAEKLKGTFALPPGGLTILLQRGEKEWIWHWKVAASLTQVAYEISPFLKLEKGQCELSFDSSTGLSSLKKMNASLCAWQGVYTATLSDFIFDPRKDSPFNLQVNDSIKNLLTLCGSVKLTQDVELSFDKEKTTVFSLPLTLENCRMGKDFSLKQIDISASFTDNTRKEAFEKIQGMQALPVDTASWLEENLPSLQGDVTAKLSYKEHSSFRVQLESEELVWKGSPLARCELIALYKSPTWKIESLKWNQSNCQATLQISEEMVKIAQLKFASSDMKLELEASFNRQSKLLDVPRLSYSFSSSVMGKEVAKYMRGILTGSTLQHPLVCDVKGQQDLTLSYDRGKGFFVKGLELVALVKGSSEMLSKVKIDTLTYSLAEGDVSLNKCKFSLTPRGTKELALSGILPSDVSTMKKDGDWELSGDVKISKGELEAQLALKPGVYVAGGKDYNLIDPRAQISATSLHLRAKMLMGQVPVFCDVQKEFSKDAPLYVLMRQSLESEGLKILCKEKKGTYEPLRIEGKLLGLEANLQKSQHISDGSFFGFVKIDFTNASSLLSQKVKEIVSTMKLGSGYTMQGHFFLPENEEQEFAFQGDIKAEKCQLLGFTLQSLQVKANISPEKVSLEDIKIEDPCGQLSIKTCQVDKDPFTNKWTLSMPLGHIREFRPSLLIVNGKKSAEKPFVLKNLSVYDFRGVVGDKKSFTGNGALQFINSNKKEFSLLDIPLEMIKDLGLDTGLLTPICGEADFTIGKGRCLFLELKNSYSESRRSEFFLSGDTAAYIDFEGNWHVDLKMKQHVLLKWSESLLVSIRGTLEKPKYSLTNVEGNL
ncbi:MAG: hypothetical protein NTX49_00465 [Chlamydiae bacterium]|nr:hypothetical protein [Chlamydiota bacterium]